MIVLDSEVLGKSKSSLQGSYDDFLTENPVDVVTII
jgi:hypothetical protein